MVDFSKLRSLSSEEREQMNKDSLQRSFEAEDRLRDSNSKTSISMTLAHEPEVRYSRSGDKFVVFRGHQEGQSSLSKAYYKVPLRVSENEEESDRFDNLLRNAGGGDKFSFAGQWVKQKLGEGASKPFQWEFRSQHLAEGNLSLAQIMEKAAAARGDVKDRTSGVESAKIAAATRGMGI